MILAIECDPWLELANSVIALPGLHANRVIMHTAVHLSPEEKELMIVKLIPMNYPRPSKFDNKGKSTQ